MDKNKMLDQLVDFLQAPEMGELCDIFDRACTGVDCNDCIFRNEDTVYKLINMLKGGK